MADKDYSNHDTQYEIAKRSLKLHGLPTQLEQAIEEMAELTVAIQNLKRGRGDLRSVLEEAVDVAIVLGSIYHQNPDYFEEFMAHKFQRLEMRLDEMEKAEMRLDESFKGRVVG